MIPKDILAIAPPDPCLILNRARPVVVNNSCTGQTTNLNLGKFHHRNTLHSILLPLAVPLAVVVDIVLAPFELISIYVARHMKWH
jgi:hypothetical protein